MDIRMGAIDDTMDSWNLIRDHPLFRDLDDTEVRAVLPYFRLVSMNAHQCLLEEGHEASIDLYVVLSGKLVIIRRTKQKPLESVPWLSAKDFIIATLSAGDSLGELSFVTGGARSATVQCTQAAKLLSLEPDQFARLEDVYPKTASRLMRNLLGSISQKLKETTDNEVSVLRKELENSAISSKSNLFFSYVIGLLCVYNLAIQQMTNLSMDSNKASLLSAMMIIVFCGVLILMIRQSELPLHFFGLTTRNWKPALKESMVWSAIIIGALIAIKWILVTYVPKYNHLTVFGFDLAHTKYLAFNFALYGFHSPIQEFISRGVLQGSLQRFFRGRNVTIRAILISNAIFSATHVHLLGGMLGIIVFVPGLFWGWLYARHDNLIGVCISHLLIGWTALFFLNLESLF